MGEWGYVSFAELKAIRIPPGFEIDCEVFEGPLKVSEFAKIWIY